jgi:methylated-DNA-[protein]-cysteine S-methyltransferase
MKIAPLTRKVYKVVLSIPLGEVRTYKWVAKKCGHPKAFRAVGQVLKRNPYPLIIPCHRVIKSDNNIGGYNQGVKHKKILLDLEKKIKLCLQSKE